MSERRSITEDPRYGASGIWARVFWLFPLGPGVSTVLALSFLTDFRVPPKSDVDVFVVVLALAVGMLWMSIGCLWIILEGYRVVQRIEVAADVAHVEPFFGKPFDIRRGEVQRVESYDVPLYKRPWTLLDRVQSNWIVRLSDGRVLLLNGRYFKPLETLG